MVCWPRQWPIELVWRRAEAPLSWIMEWTPERLFASFHGRDLFSPVAAMPACGEPPRGRPQEDGADRRPDDLGEIVHVNHCGNARRDRGRSCCRLTQSSPRRAGCWNALRPLVIGYQSRLSGMRTRTGLPKQPSIKDAQTASSVSIGDPVEIVAPLQRD